MPERWKTPVALALVACHAGCESEAPRGSAPTPSAPATAKSAGAPPPAPDPALRAQWIAQRKPKEHPIDVDWKSLDRTNVEVKLERTSCYGSCPVYSLTIDGDGAVSYHGTSWVKVCGAGRKQISREAVAELLGQFERADYFRLVWDSSCGRGMATDNPSSKTSLRIAGAAREIDHYHGDRCAPEALEQLEKAIDRVAGSAEWVKCESGCEQSCLRGSDCEPPFTVDKNGVRRPKPGCLGLTDPGF